MTTRNKENVRRGASNTSSSSLPCLQSACHSCWQCWSDWHRSNAFPLSARKTCCPFYSSPYLCDALSEGQASRTRGPSSERSSFKSTALCFCCYRLQNNCCSEQTLVLWLWVDGLIFGASEAASRAEAPNTATRRACLNLAVNTRSNFLSDARDTWHKIVLYNRYIIETYDEKAVQDLNQTVQWCRYFAEDEAGGQSQAYRFFRPKPQQSQQ